MKMDPKTLVSLNLLESSDSSEDEAETLLKKYLWYKQTNEEIPKVNNYIQTVDSYSDFEFRRNFRMSRSTAEGLTGQFQSSSFCPDQGNKQTKNAALHILSFLWFAGNKCCIRDVASRFGMAESTFIEVSNRVMDFLFEISVNVIRFPKTEAEKEKAAKDFEEVAGFPNVIGCVDGTYIQIKTPRHKIKSTYVNRHDYPSITLQGICSANKQFIDVFTGTSSKIHDARVFKLSFISKDIKDICGEKWHLVGDAAYPLHQYLLTPYRDYGNLSESQKNYNYKLSATRVKIENSFGLLKQRFRQLMKIEFNTVEKTSQFIIACCVLHNLCIQENDYLDCDCPSDKTVTNNETPLDNHNEDKMLGEMKRSYICNHLLNAN